MSYFTLDKHLFPDSTAI